MPLNFENIDLPYNNNLERGDFGVFGFNQLPIYGIEQEPEIKSGNSFNNMWIETWIKSTNYKPGAYGFNIDGAAGQIECRKIFSDVIDCNQVKGVTGNIKFNQTGRIEISTHFDPTGAGTYNSGNATRYWNDISHKTLTDRGCLFFADNGVELRNGKIVSDVEAIKEIKGHPIKKSIQGLQSLDYKTFPKVVYKKAMGEDGKLLKRDKNDNPYYYEINERGEKIKKSASDGAETTALISIMIGAIKQLSNEIEQLKSQKK